MAATPPSPVFATTSSTPKTRVCWNLFGSSVEPIFSVYLLLSLAQIIMYAETGAVPALLVDMTKDFKLTFPEQGYLGGVVYLGIALGAPLTSGLFSIFSTGKVLIFALALNAATVLMFGMTPAGNTTLLIALRWLIGFTQATLSVFCPVWVDRFASKENATKWFSWLQITVPLGIMFGYLLGWGAMGLQTAAGEVNGVQQACFGNRLACWRIPFFIQAVLTVPLCLGFSTINNAQLNIDSTPGTAGKDNKRKQIDAGNTTINPTADDCSEGACAYVSQTLADIHVIVSQFYFTSVVLVITTMYFVLMSIQYWGTDFMVVGRGYNEHQVMGWFIFASATAPTFGAILGGIVVDRMGGYRGGVKQRSFVSGTLFFIYVVGSTMGVLATSWKGGGLTFVTVCIWIVLFCGGIVVPALTGMYTAAIPTPRLKLLGSSIMLIVISIFAYGMCPIVAGYLMRSFSQSMPVCQGKEPGTCPAALEKGFTWSLWMGPISACIMLIVWVGGCFLKGDRLMTYEDRMDTSTSRTTKESKADAGEGGKVGEVLNEKTSLLKSSRNKTV